jgi:T5SS/PEP-CTERM-associated repeat protein
VGSAEIESKGSTWLNLGSLVIGQSGDGELIIKDGGTLQGNATANIAFSPGSTGLVDVFGAGSMWTNANNIRVGFGGVGTLSVRDGGVVDPGLSVIVFQDDVLTGDGQVLGTVSNSGLVRPGAPLGALTIDGLFTQSATGALEIQIGGSAASDLNDKLVVTGDAVLDGTLNISIQNGYMPTVCDEFVILTSPRVSGSFDDINFPNTPGLVWSASVGAGEVTIGVEPSPRDMLVASFGESEFHRYDGTTGGFIANYLPPNANGLTGPIDMQVGPDGAVYINDDFDRVLRFNRITGAFLGVFIPQGSGGLVDGRGMAFGPDGHLYITSTGTNRVLRYNGTTGAPMGVFGQAVSPAAPMSSPNRLAFGPDGNLYVTQLNNTVLRFGPTGTFLGTFVTAGSGGLNGPGSLDFGPDGHLYIGSTINDAILRYNGATGASMGVFVPSNSNGLDGPTDIAFGQDGHLYTTSLINSRVLRFNGTTGAPMGVFAQTNTNGMSSPFALLFVDGPTQTPGDVNNNSAVDGADLGLLLLDWGPCPEGLGACPADFDCNGDVNGADLGILLLNWG